MTIQQAVLTQINNPPITKDDINDAIKVERQKQQKMIVGLGAFLTAFIAERVLMDPLNNFETKLAFISNVSFLALLGRASLLDDFEKQLPNAAIAAVVGVSGVCFAALAASRGSLSVFRNFVDVLIVACSTLSFRDYIKNS